MNYRFSCSVCGQKIELASDMFGIKFSCPRCEQSYLVEPEGWTPESGIKAMKVANTEPELLCVASKSPGNPKNGKLKMKQMGAAVSKNVMRSSERRQS